MKVWIVRTGFYGDVEAVYATKELAEAYRQMLIEGDYAYFMSGEVAVEPWPVLAELEQ